MFIFIACANFPTIMPAERQYVQTLNNALKYEELLSKRL